MLNSGQNLWLDLGQGKHVKVVKSFYMFDVVVKGPCRLNISYVYENDCEED